MPDIDAPPGLFSSITMVKHAIHRLEEPRHFMRVKPVNRRVEVSLGSRLLATSTTALRILEVGRDVYGPVLYLPAKDIRCRLEKAPRTSHCPLKGDAVYFDLLDDTGDVIEAELAWSYPAPIAVAAALRGRIAFYADRVAITERPL